MPPAAKMLLDLSSRGKDQQRLYQEYERALLQWGREFSLAESMPPRQRAGASALLAAVGLVWLRQRHQCGPCSTQ